MPDSEAEEVGRRVIEEGWNLGRLDTIRSLVSEDYVRTGTTTLEGAEAFAQWIEQMRTAVPDLKVSIQDIVSDTGRAALRTVITGTHEADLLGMRPTGRQFTVDNMVFIEVADGQLVREWECTDVASLMAQLGAGKA